MCLISLVCVIAMRETHRIELSSAGKSYGLDPAAGRDHDSEIVSTRT
jgi:hypothetical protein